VIAVALLPMIALAALAVQRVRTERTAAASAHALGELVAFERAAAAVGLPAYAERIVLVGLTKLDNLGVPRQTVIDLSGVDFEAIYAAKRAELNAALDSMQQHFSDVVLDDGRRLGDALGVFRAALDISVSCRQSKGCSTNWTNSWSIPSSTGKKNSE
jgi:hypothetical protein